MFNTSIEMLFLIVGVSILQNLVVPVPLLVGSILSKNISRSFAPTLLITGSVIWLAAALMSSGNIFVVRYVSAAAAGYFSMGTGIVKTVAGILFAVGFVKLVAEMSK